MSKDIINDTVTQSLH